MPSVSRACYCDETAYRKCAYCKDAEDREEDRSVCESWNWNCTPRECAVDARNRGWDLRRLESAMKAFGYRSDHIAQVIYEFEDAE